MEWVSLLLTVFERNKKALCICMCVVYIDVSVCTCSCLQVDMYHVWLVLKQGINDNHLPWFLSIFIFETRSPSEFGAYGFK